MVAFLAIVVIVLLVSLYTTKRRLKIARDSAWGINELLETFKQKTKQLRIQNTEHRSARISAETALRNRTQEFVQLLRLQRHIFTAISTAPDVSEDRRPSFERLAQGVDTLLTRWDSSPNDAPNTDFMEAVELPPEPPVIRVEPPRPRRKRKTKKEWAAEAAAAEEATRKTVFDFLREEHHDTDNTEHPCSDTAEHITK